MGGPRLSPGLLFPVLGAPAPCRPAKRASPKMPAGSRRSWNSLRDFVHLLIAPLGHDLGDRAIGVAVFDRHLAGLRRIVPPLAATVSAKPLWSSTSMPKWWIAGPGPTSVASGSSSLS